MANLFAFVFLVILGMVLAAIGIALKVLEDQRRRSLTSMFRELNSGEPDVYETSILRDPNPHAGVPQVLQKIEAIRGLDATLAQAGLNWKTPDVLLATAVAAIIGGTIGLLLPIPYFRALVAPAMAVLFASFPWIYIAYKRRQRFA